MPYGDQGFFIRKSLFESMGGFPDIPIMEDFEFIRQLKKKGKVITLPVSIITSGRRWLNLGFLKTTIINQIIIAAYLMGIPPAKIALWYKNKRKGTNFICLLFFHSYPKLFELFKKLLRSDKIYGATNVYYSGENLL